MTRVLLTTTALHALVADIAHELGDGWVIAPQRATTLIGPDQLGLDIDPSNQYLGKIDVGAADRSDGRYALYHTPFKATDGTLLRTRMHLAAHRTPAALARTIWRDLLPDAYEALAQHRQRHAEQTACRNAAQQFRDEIIAQLPVPVEERHLRDDGFQIFYGTPPRQQHLWVSVNPEQHMIAVDNIRYLTIEQAIQVVRIVCAPQC